MAKRKPKIVLLLGTVTTETNAVQDWLKATGVKQLELDEYGENPELRTVLNAVLHENGSWVLDEHEKADDFEIAEVHAQKIMEVLNERLESEVEEVTEHQDVLFIKDGRITALLPQFAQLIYDSGLSPVGINLEDPAPELVSTLVDNPEMFTAYLSGRVDAAKTKMKTKMKVLSYKSSDFPEDMTSRNPSFFKDLHKAKLIKEIPTFE